MIDGEIKRLISYSKTVDRIPAYELLLKVPQHFYSSLSNMFHALCTQINIGKVLQYYQTLVKNVNMFNIESELDCKKIKTIVNLYPRHTPGIILRVQLTSFLVCFLVNFFFLKYYSTL